MTPTHRHDEDESELTQEIRRAIREAQLDVPNYSEGNHSFLKWVLSLCGALTLAAVIGGISAYAKLSTLEERTINIQRQMEENKREVQGQLEELRRTVERTRSQP